ncbi:MAG: FG-GAP-like repeat-containing protein, partial [Candidatus Methanospirareceae archaeon]
RMQREKRLARLLLTTVALLLLLALFALPAQAQEAYPAPEVAWHYTEHSGDATDLAVGDLTENGVADVAFIDTSPGTSLFALRGVDGVTRWQTHMVAGGNAIAVGDVNGDTANEVIAGSKNGTKGINVFNGSDGFFYFAYPTDSAVTDIELGDLDGDGTLDIIACDPVDDGWIYAINGTTGANLTGWPVGPLSGAVIDIALGNLDNAGGVDIAAISLSATIDTLYAYNSTGVQLWKNTSVMGRSVEVGDVDGDTEDEVVIGDYLSQHVLVYDGDTGDLEYSFPTNGRPPTEVELGDLDGDTSDVEIAVITGFPPDASLFALAVDTGQLNELWNFSIEWEPMYYGEGLAIGDVDGDNKNEVIALSDSDGYKVWAFDGLDGNGDGLGDVVWMYELPSHPNDVEVGDVDGDGDLDVLVATNQAGQSVYALFTKEEPRVPLLAPLGLVTLIALLSVIATSTLVRRKRR